MSRSHHRSRTAAARLSVRLRLVVLENRIVPAGALDPTFGGTGRVTTPYLGNGTFAEAVTVDRLGRTLVAGNTGQVFMVMRYRFDGTLDPSFGGTGIVMFGFRPDGGSGGWDAHAYAITVDSAGRVVVAGSAGPLINQQTDFAVARLLDSGALDRSFNGAGK